MKINKLALVSAISLMSIIGCDGPEILPPATCDQCPTGVTISVVLKMPDCSTIPGSGPSGGFKASVQVFGLDSFGKDSVYASGTSTGATTVLHVPCGTAGLVYEATFRLPDAGCPSGTERLYNVHETIPAVSATANCQETITACSVNTGLCIS